VIDTEATFCHTSEPPVTTGTTGAALSMRTVFAPIGAADDHAELRPLTSFARN
jgi:hypothetical protein